MGMKKVLSIKKPVKIGTVKLTGRGGDKVLTLRHLKPLLRTGNGGGSILLPKSFVELLNWKPGETKVYVGLSDDGKVLIELAAPSKSEQKAS